MALITRTGTEIYADAVALYHAEKPSAVLLNPDPHSHISYLRTTVEEEIAFPLEQRGMARAEMHEAVMGIMSRLGMESLVGKNPQHLSGGHTRLVALACVLVIGAPIVIVCDPFHGLDQPTRTRVQEVFEHYPGTVYLYHSHSPVPHTISTSSHIPGGHGELLVLPEIQGTHKRKRLLRSSEIVFSSPKVRFEPRRGEILWLRGKNGVGKSTLLHTLTTHPKLGFTVNMAMQRPQDQVLESTVREFICAQNQTAPSCGEESIDALTRRYGLDPDQHPLDLAPADLRIAHMLKAFYGQPDIVLLDEPEVGAGARIGELCEIIEHNLSTPHPVSGTVPAVIMTSHQDVVLPKVPVTQLVVE
ncbi:ATP-binding cassette domain-containing protein [Corynebacterium felinum]|uniref:Energy-coupling factor transport system ATP-binding protein n=1 Tax=Corynebacterium felinum TaxID=131318 RepID=A0ABU2B9H2_9CORY|nr:ATP-binding cassette domain-containing protein [Corynebacterium felinum]MDF5821708.1 ATP-binding cassette domain-containing protein [Corynebacterium felinum]MDR7355272.1 energy-coupling factor transport system ATP-binding protein [Corynebacterium felinum]WJY94625.1 Putative HMP/thiamine import ATP-binding protein YkoD [Corynebacterium felinum]